MAVWKPIFAEQNTYYAGIFSVVCSKQCSLESRTKIVMICIPPPVFVRPRRVGRVVVLHRRSRPRQPRPLCGRHGVLVRRVAVVVDAAEGAGVVPGGRGRGRSHPLQEKIKVDLVMA